MGAPIMRLAIGLAAGLLAGAAAAATPPAPTGTVASVPVGVTTEIHGVGQLMFGELLQWRLVSEPPSQVRAGDGIKLGGVVLESKDGKARYRLIDSAGFSSAENGPACKVDRVGVYALIRCGVDWVFDTAKGGPPVKVWPQFSDRSGGAAVPDYIDNLPLPWWEPTGLAISGSHYLFLNYGSTNYGSGIESSLIPMGPALLDLTTGQIALARTGPQAASPLYDASSGPARAAIAAPSEGDRATAALSGGRTVVLVSTTFGLCGGGDPPPCIGNAEFRSSGRRPLAYTFEPRP